MLQEKSVKDEERRNGEAAAVNLSVTAARTLVAVSPLPQFSPSEDSSPKNQQAAPRAKVFIKEKTTGLRLDLCKAAMIRVAARFPRLVREQHIPAPFSRARRAVVGEVTPRLVAWPVPYLGRLGRSANVPRWILNPGTGNSTKLHGPTSISFWPKSHRSGPDILLFELWRVGCPGGDNLHVPFAS